MPAFVILVNGKRVCTAALVDDDSIGAHLNWVGPADDPLLVFHVGGVTGGDQVGWDLPQLNVGDEVTIKIVASGTGDPPSRRQPYEPRARATDAEQ